MGWRRTRPASFLRSDLDRGFPAVHVGHGDALTLQGGKGLSRRRMKAGVLAWEGALERSLACGMAPTVARRMEGDFL